MVYEVSYEGRYPVAENPFAFFHRAAGERRFLTRQEKYTIFIFFFIFKILSVLLLHRSECLCTHTNTHILVCWVFSAE